MYLLAPFILQNFKKILRAYPELWGCAIFGPKMAHLCWQKLQTILVQTIIITLLKKKPLQRSRVMRMHHFWAQIVHLPQTNICLKIIKIILIYLLAPFIVQNFKKILPKDPELWGCAIFGPKMVHFLKWEFSSGSLLMSLVSFIHTYLHAKNQSQLLIY